MTRPNLRAIRLRFLALVVVTIVCAIASVVHIRSVGTTFEYTFDGYDELVTADAIDFSPEGMARVVDIREKPDGTPVAVIEGLQQGNGAMLVSLENSGGMSQMRVEPGNVVVADGANFTGWEALPISVSVCFAVAGILCAWAVFELRSRAWYGYEMAVYTGGAIFCLVEAAIFAWLLISGATTSFAEFALAVTALANRFVELMLLPTAVAALFVCASNVILIRKEGLRPINALGVAVSLAWAIACVILKVVTHRIDNAPDVGTSLVFYVLNTLFSVGVCLGLALFIGTCICAWDAARHVPAQPRDYLIILGCGLRIDGTPTPLLAGRVDAALSYALDQQKAGGAMPKFVPSGGQGLGEICTEAESMRQYLIEKGIDAGRILKEDRSTNTRQNLAFSAEIIGADSGADVGANVGADVDDGARQPRVAFSTTNFHVFRGYVCAHDAGLDAEGIAACTKHYFWPNAFLREFFGLIVSRRVPIACTYAVVAAIYLVAEYALFVSMG